MLRAFARVFAFLLAFALASCSTPRPLGEIQSFEAERALGEKTLPQFLRDRGGVYRDRDLTRYLNDIVERLTQNVAVPEEYQPLRVRVLNTRTPSAFALPGGAIFLSRGIIAFANDESQIAGVIAHEISHVLSRHSAKRIAANEQTLLDIARDLEQDLKPDKTTLQYFRESKNWRRTALGCRWPQRRDMTPAGLASCWRGWRPIKSGVRREQALTRKCWKNSASALAIPNCRSALQHWTDFAPPASIQRDEIA